MRKLYSVFAILLVLFACSKDDTTTPEPEPVQIPKYTVTIKAGDGGTVSSAGGTYNKDSQFSVTATPNAEYLFQAWSDGNTDNPRTIKVGADLTITANFVKKQYDLTVTVVGDGAVAEEVVIQGGRYNSGSQIKLTATAAEGWEFTSWTGAIESTDNPVTVTLDGAKEVTATFTRKKFDLTITIEGEGTVTEEVVVQPAQYDYETQVKLTAVPETGWEFSAWSGDLESTENPVTVTVEDAKNITATFTRKKYDLTVTVVGEGTVTEEVVVQPAQYDYETQVKLTAVPETGWEFSAWSGDLESTENPVTVTVEDAKNITATFTRKKFDLTVTVVGEGTVTEEVVVQPAQYDYETQVKLTAVPETGWEFTAWSGDLESTENPVTVTVEEAQDITATFVKKDTDNDGVPDLDDLCNETPEGATVNANGCHDILYLADNGVTLKARETALAGDTQEFNGTTYTVVDESTLRTMVSNNEDVSKVVTTLVTDMENLFAERATFNKDISSWDVSNVISMRAMFYKARSFNRDITKWDVSKVTDMELMFREAEAFNQPIGSWNINNVSSIKWLFMKAISFNQDISSWDMSNKTSIGGMFYDATAFNQALNNWDVSNVSDFGSLFRGASAFNQPLNEWNVEKAGNNGGMDYMFNGARSFNQDISMWCVSEIIDAPDFFSSGQISIEYMPIWGQCGEIYLDTNGVTIKARDYAVVGQSYKLTNGGAEYLVVDESTLRSMISDNKDVTKAVTTKVTSMANLFLQSNFNQNIGSWDTSNVTSMANMFHLTTSFNQDISKWDVSNVKSMFRMFSNNPIFNQDLSAWNVRKVTTFYQMFWNVYNFNSDISTWRFEDARDMKRMFAGARSFNQDLSDWNVEGVINCEFFSTQANNWTLPKPSFTNCNPNYN